SELTKEGDLQTFFEKHPHFLLRGEYKRLYPQVFLSNADTAIGDLKPDFLLERIDTGLCDIWDIKLPTPKRRQRQGETSHFHLTSLGRNNSTAGIQVLL
ncbi:MAG: hypothetical protein ACREBC_35245, partial [Pyrinomonadaceae bacterium]